MDVYEIMRSRFISFPLVNMKNIASIFIEEIEKEGVSNVCLWVLKDNIRARTFYEKNGFRVSGNEREIEIAECRTSEVEYIYYG